MDMQFNIFLCCVVRIYESSDLFHLLLAVCNRKLCLQTKKRWTIRDATFIEPSLLLTSELFHSNILVLFNFHISVPYSLEFKHTLLQFCGTSFIEEGYTYLFTYVFYFTLFTPWSGVLLEKLTGCQLVKKSPAFYGTQRFITAVTSARHLALS